MRKLSAVATDVEATAPLWRGVRGELPHGTRAAARTHASRHTARQLELARRVCGTRHGTQLVGGQLVGSSGAWAGFWVPDEQGIVCAVDMAFMSTSRQRKTPVEYMGSGLNVLWTLHPMRETDAGYHCGADVSMLSQFEAEGEVLFPPATMLAVQHQFSGPQHREPDEQVSDGKRFIEIDVVPTFV